MRILFTGGGGAATEALWRLLSPQHELYFGDADPDARPMCVPVERWRSLCPATSGAFLVDLLYQSDSMDALIPGVDEELSLIARERSFRCSVVLPDAEFVETHLDKMASMMRLRDRGIPTPPSLTMSWPAWWHYPCVLKPRRGRGSRDVFVVRSAEDCITRIRSTGRPASDFILQELLDGQEYTCTLVADKTKTLRAVVPVKVERKKGITLRGTTDHDEAVIALCKQIHAVHPFSGIVNVQCIKSADGTVKPFEINPRISTTTCLAIAAGVDVIGLALSDELAPFKTVTLRRSWQNEFIAS